MRIVLLGNAGAGKSTMARRLIASARAEVARLSLDEIAWADGFERRPLQESSELVLEFIRSNENWIIEGCYSDLVEYALPHCTELRFLNPGIEACVRNCLSRPWEPEKFASAAEQEAMLERLLEWVRTYESRTDEYGLVRHRQLYERHAGARREYTSISEYPNG